MASIAIGRLRASSMAMVDQSGRYSLQLAIRHPLTKDDLDLLRRQLGHDQLLLVKLTHPLHKPYINIYHISR